MPRPIYRAIGWLAEAGAADGRFRGWLCRGLTVAAILSGRRFCGFRCGGRPLDIVRWLVGADLVKALHQPALGNQEQPVGLIIHQCREHAAGENAADRHPSAMLRM